MTTPAGACPAAATALHDPSYEEHLNAYHVVQLDMIAFTGKVGSDVVPEIRRVLGAELVSEFGCVKPGAELEDAFLQVVRATGRRFVFVIDEWDAPFRDSIRDEEAQEHYVKFLRLLFKNDQDTKEHSCQIERVGESSACGVAVKV